MQDDKAGSRTCERGLEPAVEAIFVARLRSAAESGDITPGEIRQAAYQIEGLRKCLRELMAIHSTALDDMLQAYLSLARALDARLEREAERAGR